MRKIFSRLVDCWCFLLFVVVVGKQFQPLKMVDSLTHLVWIVNLMKKKETTKTENRMNKTLILLLSLCLLNILRSFKFHQILWMFVSLRAWFAELFFFASPLHSIHHLNMTMKSIWMNLRRIQSIPNKKENWESVCCLCFWLAMRWEQKVPQLKWCKFAQTDNHEKCCTNAFRNSKKW